MTFKHASIKKKITSMILLVSVFCTVLVLSIFVFINQQDEQTATIKNVSILAKLIGNRSHAALTFDDSAQALENLQSLDSHPLFISACLYDESGNLFAQFHKSAIRTTECTSRTSQAIGLAEHLLLGDVLSVSEPIFVDGDYIGSLLINASLAVVQEHLLRYLTIASIVAIIALILALIFASRLQLFISTPLLKLTEVASLISRKNDYSIRADKLANDEIGELVESFNHMLETIASQNKTLLETTEKANAANAIKSQFLANMSHELRTPINGVLGMNDLLMSTNLTDEQKEYVQLARQSGNVLLDTVNQILDLASIESVGLTLHPEEIEMSVFLNDVVQIFAAQLSEKRLDLTLNIEKDFPKTLTFDPVRLRQVFINIIANAIKFTKEGSIKIFASYDQSNFCVTVEDTGIGIPEDAQKRIFESFQQVDNSSTRAYGGTGLGLPIALEICNAMGGRIELLRSSPAGSAFKFTICATNESGLTLTMPKLEVNTKAIVLAEAQPFGYWLKDTLSRCYIEPKLVFETSEAIDIIEQYDLIIVDSKMGADALSKIVGTIKSQPDQKSRKQMLWLSWVGEDLPELNGIQIKQVYKPLTIFGLTDLFRRNVDKHIHRKSDRTEAKILLAEDNPINLKSIKSQLENAGFKVHAVMNGVEAVESCREQRFDLILMDIQMPKMDGKEASRIIITEQGKHAPPIVGISAHVMKEHIDSARNSGMIDYICKPIAEETLINVVSKNLN